MGWSRMETSCWLACVVQSRCLSVGSSQSYVSHPLPGSLWKSGNGVVGTIMWSGQAWSFLLFYMLSRGSFFFSHILLPWWWLASVSFCLLFPCIQFCFPAWYILPIHRPTASLVTNGKRKHTYNIQKGIPHQFLYTVWIYVTLISLIKKLTGQ